MKDLAYLLINASRHLKTRLDQKLEDEGITSTQFAVLQHVYKNQKKDGMRLADLAYNLHYDRPTITAVIKRLMKKNLIIKERNPNDGRSYLIKVSESTSDLIDGYYKVANQVQKEAFNCFTYEECSILYKLLTQLNHELEA